MGTRVTQRSTPYRQSMPERLKRVVSRVGSLAFFGSAAAGVVQFYNPPRQFLVSRGAVATNDSTLPFALAAPEAYGRSGELRVLFALPSQEVDYPLDLREDPSELAYAWVPCPDTALVQVLPPDPVDTLASSLQAPARPGFYRLVLFKHKKPELVDGPALSVMVPFSAKLGGTLNGYRIGTYLAERLGARQETVPPGFVEIAPNVLDLPLTKHLRLSDFVTHDSQETWPRYAALDARLLDKIELVIAEVARLTGKGEGASLSLDVHSGFRTPVYNRRVKRAALDSRHQYGDAADIAIDCNGDGKISSADTRIVARAVEAVERAHPDLVGGMGLYNLGSASYVHIDARGKRARWRG